MATDSLSPQARPVNAKQRHTPGPWELSEGNTSVWAISPWNARFKVATVTHPSPMNGIDGAANATLITATPELLEALELFVKDHMLHDKNEKWHVFIKARAAIAKATGSQS